MSKRLRMPGEFCWINILTSEPAKAQQFYSKLLGWSFPEMPGMGHLIEVDGSRIGGMFDVASPQTPPGTKPVLGVMVCVADAAATGARINTLGGKAQPPMQIGPNGTMVVGHDPSGANFDLWQRGSDAGTPIDGDAHGAFSWFEVLSLDSKRDRRFYTDLFGWDIETMPMPDGSEYVMFVKGELRLAGMMARTKEMEMVPPWWAVYFTVRDVDAAAKQALELGATLFVPVLPIKGVGRFCGIVSPQGIHFYVIQYERA